jgi:hypothetical protein
LVPVPCHKCRCLLLLLLLLLLHSSWCAGHPRHARQLI